MALPHPLCGELLTSNMQACLQSCAIKRPSLQIWCKSAWQVECMPACDSTQWRYNASHSGCGSQHKIVAVIHLYITGLEQAVGRVGGAGGPHQVQEGAADCQAGQ